MTSPTTTVPVVPTFQCNFSVEVAGGRPVLFISFRCPQCKAAHHHTWDVGEGDVEDWSAHHRGTHCRKHGFFPSGYYIQPRRTPANETTYLRYAELLRAHQRRAARPAAPNPPVT